MHRVHCASAGEYNLSVESGVIRRPVDNPRSFSPRLPLLAISFAARLTTRSTLITDMKGSTYELLREVLDIEPEPVEVVVVPGELMEELEEEAMIDDAAALVTSKCNASACPHSSSTATV